VQLTRQIRKKKDSSVFVDGTMQGQAPDRVSLFQAARRERNKLGIMGESESKKHKW